VLSKLSRELEDVAGASVTVHTIENRFFGPRVNVSGLLVAADIETQLRSRDLGDMAVLPRYSLDYTGHRFLDDATPAQLQDALGVPLAFASTLSGVLQILGEPLESRVSGATMGEASNGKSWVDWSLEPAAARGGQGLAKEVRR
jgi:NifB/MoaA-like Fe-S oxidoreductase